MGQYLKQDVQAQIADAALALFAEKGFASTSMAEVAARAGIATGNVYRYFENKQVLFDEAIGRDFVARWVALFERRFAAAKRGLGPEWRAMTEEMRALSIVERRKIIVLLRDPSLGVKQRLVELCCERCAEHFSAKVSLPLRLIYQNLFEAVAVILENGGSEADLDRYNAYHLGGLKELFA